MALTKKDFEHFAVIIAACRFVDPHSQTLQVIQNHLASLFAEKNAKFDRVKWQMKIDTEIDLLEKQKKLHDTRSLNSSNTEGKSA